MAETERNGNSWSSSVWAKVIGGILAVIFSAIIGLAITLLLSQLTGITEVMETKLEALRNEVSGSKIAMTEAIGRDMGGLGDGIARLQKQVDELRLDIRRVEAHLTAIRMWAERGGAGTNGTPSPDPPPR